MLRLALSRKGRSLEMALRNLYSEFSQDSRMAPLDRKRRSLADDWVFEIAPSPNSVIPRNIAKEVLRFRFIMVADSSHRQSDQLAKGRILYLQAPEIRGSAWFELGRGFKLGEIWDLVCAMTDHDVLDFATSAFILPSQEEYDDAQARTIALKEEDERIKSEILREQREGGMMATRGSKRPMIVWKSSNARAFEAARAEEVERNAETRREISAMRSLIKEALSKDDAPEILAMMRELCISGDENLFSIEVYDKALQLEMALMEKRLAKLTSGV